jgi:two-component system, NarL family, response regulator NreC
VGRVLVLLADDHAILRSGLRLLLEREPDFAVVGEAADGRAAIDWLVREPADVAAMDLGLPGLNSIEATAQIALQYPKTAVIMLSINGDETYVLRCLRAGARGYILKDSAEHEWIAAIRAVMAGKSYFSPKVKRLLHQDHVARLRRSGREDRFGLLTAREWEILQLIAEGNSNKEIATRLFLSVYTVETHRKNILETLKLHCPADLILYAVRRGMVV